MKYLYKSIIGDLELSFDRERLVSLKWGKSANYPQLKSGSIKKMLDQFFLGSMPSAEEFFPTGTQFQQKVWKEVSKIPFGQTRSYKEIAINIGMPKASRAVGNANGQNPICLLVPCHRVICSNGNIGGYNGGVEFKKRLLDFEKGFVV